MNEKMICSVCKKRPASVFITQMDNTGKSVNKGVCLVCAKKMGLPQVDNIIKQMGISEEDLENVYNDMEAIGGELAGLQEDNEQNPDQPTDTLKSNFFKFFENLGMNKGSMESPDEKFRQNEKSQDKPKDESKNKFKFLSQYGTDLTEKAASGKIDDIIGRTREIERVSEILNRRSKNNPVLVGEAGVGKTAIAEGLALLISRGNVPVKLQDKKVFLLDLTAMVAGTQFRGQFEGRMKGLIDEVKKAGNIILVIDEIHNLMGAGEADGAMNAANILKPALSRGEIQVIGATTLKEYRKYIEKDSALERRFQPVMVNEPTVSETIDIIKGIRKYYEDFHKVIISDSIAEDAVRMSERYITDRFLPDKAIDVIDEASARANLNNLILPEISKNEAETASLISRISEEESKTYEKSEEDRLESFKIIAELKSRLTYLQKTHEELKSKEFVQLTYNDIAKVIENWTGIPVHTMSADESEKLISLEEKLKLKVIGQDSAVETLSRAIRRNRSGFRKKYKPSSFIFVGPTGVGKTELVKQLSVELFGTEEALVRLDMSEYMEKHTVSKLIGSPPGYVGYDEAGQLTEKIRRRPYSVILFDEIEKAHPDVFNMLLQILDDGRLTDSQGRVVNFENTIIIMTSNAGNSLKAKSIGFVNDAFKAISENANDALKNIFRPEFLNRIDEIVVFNRLSGENLVNIAKLMLHDVLNECAEKNIKVNVSDDVYRYLSEKGFSDDYGARPMRKLISKTIEDKLTDLYLRGEMKPGDTVNINLKENEIDVTVSEIRKID